MYRMPVIIGKISPDRANRTPTRSKGKFSFPLKGPKFDRRRSIHYPAYYSATCQNEKITSHGVACYNLFVTRIRSVDQQRNSLPKTLTSHVTGLFAERYQRRHYRQKVLCFLDSGQFISSIHRKVVKSPCK